jgi:FMN phosphatase YigB (HAD superfamily)
MDDTISFCQERFDAVEHELLSIIEAAGLRSGREYLGKVPNIHDPAFSDYSQTYLAVRNSEDARLFPIMGYSPDRIRDSALSAYEVFSAAHGMGFNASVAFDLTVQSQMLRHHDFGWYDETPAMLQQLAGEFNLVLLTRGELGFQHTKLDPRRTEVTAHFARVYITPDKDVDVFAAVFRDCAMSPGPQHVAIGNTYKTDVAPPLTLGCSGIFLDRPAKWVLETQQDNGLSKVAMPARCTTVMSLSDIAPQAIQLCRQSSVVDPSFDAGLNRLFAAQSGPTLGVPPMEL